MPRPVRRPSPAHRSTDLEPDRGSFGGVYGLLFAVVVVTSAVTATLAYPTEPTGQDRPQTAVDTIATGIDHEVSAINHDPGEAANDISAAKTSASRLPDEALADIPADTRGPLRARLDTFLDRLAAQQARSGSVTRVRPAVDGIVRGAVVTHHGGDHTVEQTVTEPYTVDRRVVDHYSPVLDRYERQWSRTRPGPAWDRIGGARLGHREVRWAVDSPGTGWLPTGRTRPMVVDVETTERHEPPGPDWTRGERVGTERLLAGSAERTLWSDAESGGSVYSDLLGYTHAGIVERARLQTGTTMAYRWTTAKSDRDHALRLAGYRYAGLGRTKQVRTGTATQWRWADQSSPGSDWSVASRARLFRGYRTRVSPSKPGGRDWQRAGVDHVELKIDTGYETRTVWGWHDVTVTVPHVHYKTTRTWVPGRTEVITDRTWKSGYYKTVSKRTWVGWKKVTKKKWVRGYWKKKRVRKTVTRWKKKCRWKWSWRRGFYKKCSKKKVTRYKTVTKRYRTSGYWKKYTTRKWVGWKTVTKKQWVPGRWITKTYHKKIPGYWKQSRVKTGIHLHTTTKRVWGKHQRREKVVTTRTIRHYKWRKPVYDWKLKYERPTSETRYQHVYERPVYQLRYKHRYTKPVYEERPVYRWERPVTETGKEYERLTRWQRPVYRLEPVYRTAVETRYRTRTVTHDVAAAPLTYDGRPDWDIATGVTDVRDAAVTVERTLLTANRTRPTRLRVDSETDGTAWSLAVWRDGEAIVVESSEGIHERLETPRAQIDLEAGTINGQPVGLDFAEGVTGPYTIGIDRGDAARGSFTFTLAGRPRVTTREGDLEADEAPLTVTDGIVYSAAFDVTVRTDRTTYTDRLRVEPAAGQA